MCSRVGCCGAKHVGDSSSAMCCQLRVALVQDGAVPAPSPQTAPSPAQGPWHSLPCTAVLPSGVSAPSPMLSPALRCAQPHTVPCHQH